jgi:PKD repeat protein
MHRNRNAIPVFPIKVLVLILVVSLFFCLSRVLFAEVKAETEVQILSHSGYTTPENMFRVVGEVTNLGNRFLGPVFLNFTFYDTGNNIILSKNDSIILSVLAPNRTSPFTSYVVGNQASMVSSYSVSVASYSLATARPYDLNIVAQKYDNTSVYGVIENRGYVNVSSTMVYATFYDDSKKVVDSSSTDPGAIEDIERGKSTAFEISHLVLPHIFERAKWYSLTAECLQYSLMQEEGLVRFLPPPFATLASYPSANVTLGQAITFNATGSHASENRTIVSYNWAFGDNSTGKGITITHTYAAVGNYTVELTVKDNEGLDTMAIQIVRVTEDTTEGGDPNIVFYTFGAMVGISAAILFTAVIIAKKRQKPKRRRQEKAGRTE